MTLQEETQSMLDHNTTHTIIRAQFEEEPTNVTNINNNTNVRKSSLYIIYGLIVLFIIALFAGTVNHFFIGVSKTADEGTTTTERESDTTTEYKHKVATTDSPTSTESSSVNNDLDDDYENVFNVPTRELISKFSNYKNFEKFPRNCGNVDPSFRIQHGEKAKLYEHPWIVTIFNYSTNDEDYFCGGSLLSETLILTAAHCIKDQMLIRLGSFEFDKDGNSTQTFYDRDFTTIVHENYSTTANDIALIKLKHPATFNNRVQPLCLPFYIEELPKQGQIIGFGLRIGIRYADKLMKGNVNITKQEDCVEMYKNIITENNFCAWGKDAKNKTIDTCRGDSGSPLLFPIQNYDTARYTQVGITSQGQNVECGRAKTKPGIYVKVASYLEWILNNAN